MSQIGPANSALNLGIEIGGTKLQLGVGRGDGSSPVELVRLDVLREDGAAGILEQIRLAARPLVERHGVAAVGIGFGGPVDVDAGRTVTSHHVAGWDGVPLVAWCADVLQLPAALANDADAAGLAEALCGAGRGRNPVLYVTVGTGIGGGLVIDGNIYRGNGAGAAELGHLLMRWPGARPADILESAASGLGIAAAARRRIAEAADADAATGLLARAGGSPLALTARHIIEAAREGNWLAREVLASACDALGWGIAQAITLMAPAAVVVGGGVSLAGEELFVTPLRAAIERYVFPPFRGTYALLPAALGEGVVVHGALILAARLVDS